VCDREGACAANAERRIRIGVPLWATLGVEVDPVTSAITLPSSPFQNQVCVAQLPTSHAKGETQAPQPLRVGARLPMHGLINMGIGRRRKQQFLATYPAPACQWQGSMTSTPR